MDLDLTHISVEIIEKWLSEKPTTSWVNWDITDPKERREAAEWMYNQLMQLLAVIIYAN